MPRNEVNGVAAHRPVRSHIGLMSRKLRFLVIVNTLIPQPSDFVRLLTVTRSNLTLPGPDRRGAVFAVEALVPDFCRGTYTVQG